MRALLRCTQLHCSSQRAVLRFQSGSSVLDAIQSGELRAECSPPFKCVVSRSLL
jgi:hypothetical protein